ncbi:hypothetical protein ACSVH2_11630 [Flavobacterium sp. RSB2_4_14]|uniref:hypothetical protein n=1 Tax=Flavobacterium sp. RSB2_4_14 TaxID=3447665 RepID=UPI003F3D9506
MGVLSIKILPNHVIRLATFLFVIFIFNSCNLKLKKEINSNFENVKRIEILAYIDRNQWNKEDNPDFFKINYIKNGKLEINKKYLKNRISLNKEQIEILKNGLIKCKTENYAAACYDPRHAILFYDENDKIFGYIELCFDCNGSRSSDNFNSFSGCALGLQDTFKEFGITYFGEIENNN